MVLQKSASPGHPPSARQRRVSNRLLVMVALLGMACERAEPARKIVVGEVTRCLQTMPAVLLPELRNDERGTAFFSQHPLAQIEHHGGPTLPALRIIGVFFGNDPLQELTVAFLESYGCTASWRDVVSEYGVGDAIYLRSLVLPAYPALDEALEQEVPGLGFEAWIRERARAGAFGKLAEQDALMFFVPPGLTRISPGVGGYHNEVPPELSTLELAQAGPPPTGPAPGTLKYAVVYTADSLEGRFVLDARTGTASHELIEIATDPYPYSHKGWATFDRGVVPSVAEAWEKAGEISDYCTVNQAPLGYPFVVASAYSNRRARAGLNPCSSSVPLRMVAALQGETRSEREGVDFSSGERELLFDLWTFDPRERFAVSTVEAVIETESGRTRVLPLSLAANSTDGDTARVVLAKTTLPSWLFTDGERTKAQGHKLKVTLCPREQTDECETQTFPLVALPPREP